MNATNKCPQCGGALPASALAGLCPACLLKQGAMDSGSSPLVFTPPTPAELAAQLPQLEVLELIGKGGMGAVYRARQKELDRVVALKILPPGVSGDPTFAERFAREAKALAKLNHPNIVTIYDFGSVAGVADPGRPASALPATANKMFYFVMEFVDGVNLRQLLRDRKLEPEEALADVDTEEAEDAGAEEADETFLEEEEEDGNVADIVGGPVEGEEEP